MNLPSAVTVREVGTRDGFQMERGFIATEDKVQIVDELTAAGIRRIEVTSFVSPRAVPQLADAEEVFARAARRPGVSYEVLVANSQGARRAVAAGAERLLVVIAASDVFNRANVNMTMRQSLEQAQEISQVARGAGVPMIGALAAATACPYTGEVPQTRVLWLADQFVELGVSELYVADSIGMGYPKQVRRLTAAVRERFPSLPLIVHLHNTRGMALANVMAALEVGATTFDASIGGLGGCPFAPGASGNLCTEDLVHMLHGLDIDTGIDLDALLATSARVERVVGHRLEGAVVHAGKSFQAFPIPPQLLAPDGVRTVQDVEGLAFQGRPPNA
ncbi:MAG: hydroxymethylglutaryl-CoA lyase [Candidatus Dormibacter sp.]|uniref:hydroxymethylglutaryl-CoA lyase n=1 Tax=Candidatus Dormibacter sp. TaxID=2973982 RepID=UPI000DB3C347|nr:MAG: hydroxymethylglutaryl-CoA lyase [Candidatus Dormibacteraeota bacterium]